MKTLKKTLCLVLAVVMVVGALVLPASAAYNDEASIKDAYKTAVNTLNTWGIMLGDNGNFKPTSSIQRQEMAAIVYRLLTGDVMVNGKDNSAIYAPDAAKFTDVKSTDWAVGYIGYCASKGIILGTNAAGTTFEPTRAIPANDVLAMLLRAVGYGQKGEYTGPGWTTNIAADAARIGLTKGITDKLDKISERQEVAQMTYQAATTNRMTWSEAEQKYIPYVTPNNPGSDKNIPLVKTETVEAKAPKYDIWGAPTGGTAATTKVIFTYPSPAKENTLPAANAYPMLWQTWDAVTECAIATGLNVKTDAHWAITYTNGINNKNLWNGNTTNANAIPFEATDTVNKIGHEGRHLMVYANPDYTGSNPSATNPDYIFVFVDEFYARVTGIVSEVKDPAGHVLVPASANVTVYSNDYATGSQTTATSANVAVLNTSLTGTGYKEGQVLGVHLQTAANNALAGSTVVTEEDAAGYGPVDLNNVTVTVKEITMDATGGVLGGSSSNKSVGIVATNGTYYYYDYTFGKGTAGSAPVQLTGSDIGKEVVLTLDSQGNILNWAYATSATVGYGVTLSASVKQTAIGQYALTYTILKSDGSTVTVDVGQPTTGAAFTTQTEAENFYNKIHGTVDYTTAGVGANELVYFAFGSTGPYNTLAHGNVTGLTSIDSIKSGRPEGLFEDYSTDPVRGGTSTAALAGALVNDKTVFFVANYAPDNTTTSSANDYKFIDYSIYVGDKNIPDMAFTSTDETLTPGSSGSPATFSHLTVQAFSGTPSGSPVAGDYASYVLVVNATQQSKPKTIPTMDFAYLITDDLFVNMGANTFTYPAIINGKSGQTLQVKLAGSPLDTQGLYSYADWVNGVGYEDVVLMDGQNSAGHNGYTSAAIAAPYNGSFTIAENLYGYANGVLTSYNAVSSKTTPAATDVYYTVADGCPVYLINPTTGAVTTGSLGLLSVSQYAEHCDIWFQLDANGYVSLIYVIETATATSPVPPTTNSLTLALTPSDTYSASGSTITISSTGITSTGTGTAASGTYNYKVEVSVWTTGTGWVTFCTYTTTNNPGTIGTALTSVSTGTPLPATSVVNVKLTATTTTGNITSNTVEFSFATT